jgi:hypothetical protein
LVVRPSSIRLTSALLALVWITAPLAAVFHGMAEVHRYCAEHRGFEEGTEATQVGDGRAGAHEEVVGGEASDHSEEHQPCAFKATWRSDQTLRGPDLQVAPAPEPAHVALVSLEAPRLADVLASAPKTSPPHLAA